MQSSVRERAGKSDPLVYVVIVTFNGKRHLERLLPSLPRTNYDNWRVVIVDNASSDGSAEFLESEYPEFPLVKMSENLGFAGANNVGIQLALDHDADYVFLLNNDTEIIDPSWLRESINLAEQTPDVGFVGLEEVCEINDRTSARTPSARRVDRVSGSSMLIKANVIREVGFLDETYFMYGEEDDLQARATRAGYVVWRINATVYHAGMGTSKSQPGRFAYYQMRNSIRFGIKQKGFVGCLKRIVRTFEIAASPKSLIFDKSNAEHRRIRNSGKIVPNTFLFTSALGWNLFHLPETLQKRSAEARQAHQARVNLAERMRADRPSLTLAT